MRYQRAEFTALLPDLNWSAAELADKLSVIGHEAEAIGETIEVTLTSNRKDCRDLRYLAFDLAGVYNLKVKQPPEINPGQPINIGVNDVNRILGSNITQAELGQLNRLGFVVNDKTVTPPDFRDVTTKADVAEEILRMIGLKNIAVTELDRATIKPSPSWERVGRLKASLASLGFTETMQSSFTANGTVKLKNPFSDTEPYLRPSLEPGLLKTLAKNPFLKRAAFFEIGQVFSAEEETRVGLILAGYKDVTAWQRQLSSLLGKVVVFDKSTEADCQRYVVKQGRVVHWESPIEAVKLSKPSPWPDRPIASYQKISKFPPLIRDITIIADTPRVSQIINEARKQFTQLLFAEVIDRFENNVTIRFIFQPDQQSFNDEQIETITHRLEQWLR